MPKQIVEHIRAVCKEHGIQYTSRHDAQRLGELVTNFNTMTDEIYSILDRHDIKSNFKQEIETSLLKLHALDHELIQLAKQLKNAN